MVRDDIFFALKNASERGEDISSAVESLISAGYPREEVENAAQRINFSSPNQFHNKFNIMNPQANNQQTTDSNYSEQENAMQKYSLPSQNMQQNIPQHAPVHISPDKTKKRNKFLVVLFTILTLGIYLIVIKSKDKKKNKMPDAVYQTTSSQYKLYTKKENKKSPFKLIVLISIFLILIMILIITILFRAEILEFFRDFISDEEYELVRYIIS